MIEKMDYESTDLEKTLALKIMEKDKEIERQKEIIRQLDVKNLELTTIIKEVREKVDSFDVFKEFTFPLMKRDVENQVKSSIDYEWRKTIKEPILEILDKENNNEKGILETN